MTTYSPPALTATWYDDEPEFVEQFAPVLEEVAGLEVQIRDTNVEDPTSGDVSPVALVDLDLGVDYGLDGLLLARRLIARSEPVAILLVSRYFATERYHAIDRHLSPTVPVARIEKNDIVILSNAKLNAQFKRSHRGRENPYDVQRAKDHIEQAVQEVRRQIGKTSQRGVISPDLKALKSIYVPPIDEYFSSSRAEQAAVIFKAKEVLAPYLKALFRSHGDVSWVTLGVPTGETLKWGKEGDDSPRRKSEVMSLARESEVACVPVTFHRPRVLEIDSDEIGRTSSNA